MSGVSEESRIEELAESIDSLISLRAHHEDLINKIDAAISMLNAILSAESALKHPSTAPRLPGRIGQPRSVHEAVLRLANSANRDWSVPELQAEIERRGISVDVADLTNSLHSAVSRAHKNGDLIRVGPGRYRSSAFPEDLGTTYHGGGEPLE